MKTFFCLLLLSITALSQTKNTQRYQIVECKPTDEHPQPSWLMEKQEKRGNCGLIHLLRQAAVAA